MKKGVLYLFLLFAFNCRAALLKWDGGAGDHQWMTAENWDLDRLPAFGDEVVLDNTYIAAGYTVFLPAGAISVSLTSLLISPAPSYSITCILPSTNTATPALTLTGTGDVFVLDRGAVFKNASGAGSGTPVTVTAAGFFRINNGGHYIHQTARGHTDFLVSRLSAEAGTEQGVFEFNVPGTAAYTVSVSNRVFGKLVFSADSSGSNRTYTGAGINPVTVRGGMEIRPNAQFSYGANTDTFHVSGTCLIHAGAVFNIANGSVSSVIRIAGDLDNRGLITETGSTTGSTLLLNGTVAQNISCAGAITQQVKWEIDNPAGVNLLTPLIIPYQLQLVKGTMHTSAVNLLTLGIDAACWGGSAESFIEGPVNKKGNTAFDFPVGLGAIYAPISIGDGGLATDEFQAEYKRANPQSAPGLGNTWQSPLHHISYVEYWNLLQAGGNSPRRIKLTVSPYSFAYNLPALVVARADNGEWVSEGGNDYNAGASAPPYVTGTFTSNTEVQEFGAFTLGSLVDQQQNPLPVSIEFFTADLNNGGSLLRWRTGICPTIALRFDVQRSEDGQFFETLATIGGSDTACIFQYRDAAPRNGYNYYRLRWIGENNEISFSRTEDVFNPWEPRWRISGVATDELVVYGGQQNNNGNTKLLIIDVSGRIVGVHRLAPAAATGAVYRLSIHNLAKGVYWVVGEASGNGAVGGGKNRIGTFIKE